MKTTNEGTDPGRTVRPRGGLPYRRRRGFTATVLMTLLALMLTACGGSSDTPEAEDGTEGDEQTEDEQTEDEQTEDEQTEATVLSLGHIRTTDDNPWHESAQLFAELVEEKTGGAYTVEIFGNAELGGTVDMFSGMQSGSVDMMLSGITAYPFIDGAEPFNITAMPFLWESGESMQSVLDSEIFADFFEEAAANSGVRALAVRGEADARQLSANRPIRTPEDFQGLKIRVAPSEMTNAAFSALGAEPIILDFSELYTSLRQEVVDAQENGFATIRDASLYEVQDYLMPTYYIRELATVFISDALYQEIPAEHQEALREAWLEAGEEFGRLMADAQDADLEFLSENMEVVEPDLDALRAALDGAFDQFDGELWPAGLEDEIREAQQ